MANPHRPELSSVFNNMLAQTKKRFDDLYGGGGSSAGKSSIKTDVALGRKAASAPSPILASANRLAPDSPVVRRLTERFGADWRYEIAEQRRDGDEAIVLCKLIFNNGGATRMQFGSAKISGRRVTGASGGVPFELGTAGTEQDERDAFRRAAEAALMNCIDLV
jgi:hypothetical protein